MGKKKKKPKPKPKPLRLLVGKEARKARQGNKKARTGFFKNNEEGEREIEKGLKQ